MFIVNIARVFFLISTVNWCVGDAKQEQSVHTHTVLRAFRPKSVTHSITHSPNPISITLIYLIVSPFTGLTGLLSHHVLII